MKMTVVNKIFVLFSMPREFKTSFKLACHKFNTSFFHDLNGMISKNNNIPEISKSLDFEIKAPLNFLYKEFGVPIHILYHSTYFFGDYIIHINKDNYTAKKIKNIVANHNNIK